MIVGVVSLWLPRVTELLITSNNTHFALQKLSCSITSHLVVCDNRAGIALVPGADKTSPSTVRGSRAAAESKGGSTCAEAQVTSAQPRCQQQPSPRALRGLRYHQQAAAGETELSNSITHNPDFCPELKQHCSQSAGLRKEEKHSVVTMLAANNTKKLQLYYSPHCRRKMPLLKSLADKTPVI